MPPVHRLYLCLITAILMLYSQLSHADIRTCRGGGLESMPLDAYSDWLASLHETNFSSDSLVICEPLSGAVLPSNAAAPLIVWETTAPTALVRIQAETHEVQALCQGNQWEPDAEAWKHLRKPGQHIKIIVNPVGGEDGRSIFPGKETQIIIDTESLESPIAYLQLPVPFRTAKMNPGLALWRMATVDATNPPTVFMHDLPICANCHAYSTDGSAMLLDTDIDGDKGGFVLTDTKSAMTVPREDCGSWNTLPPAPPSPYSFGLFARLNANGNLVAATVGETSLFVMIDRDDFSQLFYPVTGQIGIFDRGRKRYTILSGSDDPAFVHTGPCFSPPGDRIVFSRAPISQAYIKAVKDKTVSNESSNSTIHSLNNKYPYQFDLCSLPFPNTDHAEPILLPGASNNGKSNYFPRYSPDNRWIVFTQAPTGLVLQPGSRLCIIPAQGGPVRELSCNTPSMNSWHSWSPDGRWMVFSGKGKAAETQLFLTRMHEDGNSSPAVRLHRLSLPRYACVVPEFLSGQATKMRTVTFGFEQQTRVNPVNNVR